MSDKRTWSHSQKSLYRLCRSKWYKQYFLGLQPGPDTPALILGGFVHLCLEIYLHEKFLDFGSNKSIDMLLLNDIIESQNRLFPQVISSTDKRLATQLVAKGLSTLAKDCKQIYLLPSHQPAIELQVEISGSWPVGYRGVIDLLYEDRRGRLVLLDWKTSSYPYPKDAVKTSAQLKGYAWLCEDGDLVSYNKEGIIVSRQKLGIIPQYLAFGVLNKREETATLLKTKNDRDYRDVIRDIEEIDGEVERGIKLIDRSSFFRKNFEACYSYGNQCFFYSFCWSGDTRHVNVITLVPSLGGGT